MAKRPWSRWPASCPPRPGCRCPAGPARSYAELLAQGLASDPMSVWSLPRILAENPVKPWQYQSWIYPRDPDFAAKASVILDLYRGYYQGRRLAPGDQILSVDAKPSIQARARCHPTSPPARGQPMRAQPGG